MNGSDFVFGEPILRRVANAQNLDRLVVERKKDPINVPSPPEETATDVAAEPGGFIGLRPDVGIIGE